MTEEEWLTGGDPGRLYQYARRAAGPSPAAGRRQRLYACACCRQVWPLLHAEGRAAVEAAEGHADGRVAPADLRAAGDLASGESFAAMVRPLRVKGIAGPPRRSNDAVRCARWAAMYATRLATEPAIATRAAQAAWFALHATACLAADRQVAVVGTCRSLRDLLRAAGDLRADRQAAVVALCRAQCDLLRDVFGNPFRPVQLDPAWLHRNDGAAPKLAQAVYDERAFERLPLLADALEDAGCGEEALLAHLRGPGPHARGCWAVDLILGKQ